MKLEFTLNGSPIDTEVPEGTTVLSLLRQHLGIFGVKHGCETGECGACTVLLDGIPVNTCVMLVPQIQGRQVETIEAVGEHPEQGWRDSEGLHPIQGAFVETGAIQCGYCTPAMVLAAKALIEKNPMPNEEQARDALSGILCRCTGYKKPIQAILRAAARMRGEEVEPIGGLVPLSIELFEGPEDHMVDVRPSASGPEIATRTSVIKVSPQWKTRQTVGKPVPKVDAVKLVQGKPAFTADLEMRAMLIAKVLHSPLAHARIKRIDVSSARALPGVAAVLTWQDLPRVIYSTAGQSDPIPGPLDSFSLDKKVRFVSFPE